MRFLPLAALLLAAPLAHAQATFGLKGGLNTAFFSGPDSDGLDARLGAVGGATLRFDANPGFGIGAEVLYSQKGARYVDPVSAEFDEDYHFDYLEVPVYGRLAVPTSPTLDVGVQLGGYVGIPLRSGGTDIDGDFDVEANTDYGALIGLDVGSGPFYAEARYSLGLGQVTDDETLLLDLPVGAIPDLQNQTISLTFGVRFGGSRY
ncbi:MAG: porin family protein [Bacteroidota bacterium]